MKGSLRTCAGTFGDLCGDLCGDLPGTCAGTFCLFYDITLLETVELTLKLMGEI